MMAMVMMMIMMATIMTTMMSTTMVMMMTRHEVPVSGEQIEVISMDDDLVVVRIIFRILMIDS